ncbi:MAG: hypothetical protein ACE5MM_08100 [Nitrospiraceae bacterium]
MQWLHVLLHTSGRRSARMISLVAPVVLAGWVSLLGCASDASTAPEPTQSQVQSDADQLFHEMKQEETKHGTAVQGTK